MRVRLKVAAPAQRPTRTGEQMPTSVTSVFSNLNDFAEALRSLGIVHLAATGPGEFRARLTRVELQHLRIWSAGEHVPRIGFHETPTDVLLVLFAIGDQPAPVWGGVHLTEGELLTCFPHHRFHVRTEGPCRWGAVSLPAEEFRAYFSELTGEVLATPVLAQRWRPPAMAGKRFMRLHAAAARAAQVRPNRIVDPEAAHGMEQQVIHSLVGCLSVQPTDALGLPMCQSVVSDLENILQHHVERQVDVTALSAALAISPGRLRRCCKEILGISPAAYVHLHLSGGARRASQPGTAPAIAMQS